MAEEKAPDAETLLTQLMQSGFFEQFGELEKNLRSVAADLKTLGEATTKRQHETESLAVHVLAIEAVLAAVLQKLEVDTGHVRELAQAFTSEGGSTEGNPAVLSVVEEILTRARGNQ